MRNLLLLLAFLLNFAENPLPAAELPNGILFVGVASETSDIYLWQPTIDGSKVTALTRTAQKEGNAQWWPQKGLIVASREQASGRYGLVALNDRLETIWEAVDASGSLGWPVPSPWDDRILCVRGLDNGFVQTGIVRFPDGVFEPFEFEGLSGGQLAWVSPEQVLLSRVTQDGFVLTHRDLVTGKEEVIVSGGQNWQSFVNQTTGRKFFVRRVGQTGSIFELFKNSEDGWEYTNLTNGRNYDWQPSTSVDGKTLIFQSLRNGRFVTILKDLEDRSEKTVAIEGFSQIYFPTIIDQNTCEKLVKAAD